MGDSPTSAIGTPEEIRIHMRALQAAGVDQVILLHQGGKLEHGANLESLELFANEVMPEFVADEDRREAVKSEQLAPAIEAALARKKWMPVPDEIPTVAAYGHFSHMPTKEDVALETSAATVGGCRAHCSGRVAGSHHDRMPDTLRWRRTHPHRGDPIGSVQADQGLGQRAYTRCAVAENRSVLSSFDIAAVITLKAFHRAS